MPAYTYILEASGTVFRRGPVYRETPPKVGEPAFGTPGTTWVVTAIEPSNDHNIAGIMHCSPQEAKS
jgi:hypothetical protein